MKTIKIILSFALASTLFTSCYTEVIVDDFTEDNSSLNQLLGAYDLWYVDINNTIGYGETPFLQKAFTISFINGLVYANNNIAGLGDNGNGFGIDVGEYTASSTILDIQHDIDGFSSFNVYKTDSNTIELYNPNNDTSYFLDGYQRSNFDYDFVFYDNIDYFLQEYTAWEKTYTSDFGAINEFDNENFLQFLSDNDDATFKSSQNNTNSTTSNLIWDYTGVYNVRNISGNDLLKILTLDYSFLDNEYFELSVINDSKIRLFHPSSETVYEFEGRGYIQYLRPEGNATHKKTQQNKKRKHRKDKKVNPRKNTIKN